MNKTKLLGVCCILLVVINLALLFFILNGPKPGPRPNEDRNRNIIIEKLNFDKQQIQQYDSLINIHKEKTHRLTENINKDRHQLYEWLNKAENTNNIDSIITKIGKQQAETEQNNFEHFLAIKKICKPEQLIKYKELTNQLSDLFDKTQKPPHRNESERK